LTDTVTFPVGTCPQCGPNRLLHTILDESDDLRLACVHCDGVMAAEFQPMWIPGPGLAAYGYDVDGSGEGGCSSGSCGDSCSSESTSTGEASSAVARTPYPERN